VTGSFEERKVQELVFKFITDTVTWCLHSKPYNLFPNPYTL
jgi:hypothetical protein